MVVLEQRDIDDPGSDSWDEDDVVLVPMAMPEITDPEDEETAGMGFMEVMVQLVDVAAQPNVGDDAHTGVVTPNDWDSQSVTGTPAPGPAVNSSVQTDQLAAEVPSGQPAVEINPSTPATPNAVSSPKKRHSSSGKKKAEKDDEEEKSRSAQGGRRRMRRLEREHEAERLLNRLLSKHRVEIDDQLECPFMNVSVFTRLFQNADHMRLWLSFAHASEEDQEGFLRWGRRPDRKRVDDARPKTQHRRKDDPEKCRPNVAPRKAFNMIAKKLRRQLVHGHIRLPELALIEQDVLLSFYARYPTDESNPNRSAFSFLRRGGGGGDEFLDEIVAGVPSGGLEDHRLVEAAESEGRQVIVVPIGTNCRPAVNSIAQYYGLTCDFLRNVAGQLYALLKNNFDDFPMPLKCLHEMTAEFKESLLVP